MQVCYFTGDMRKVDWQKHSEHRKPTVVATPSLDTLSIRALPSSTRPDWRGRVQGKENASFGQAVTLPGPFIRQKPKWILQIFYANSHWYMWRPREREREEKEKEWQREYERARETEEDREQHIFRGTAPRCSNLIVFSEKGWSVREIHLFFNTGKCGIDRWTLCSSVTAQCKVMRERQIHSLYHKKVCSCLRRVCCMRIHELHWPPFNTFSWDEYRQYVYSLWETFTKLVKLLRQWPTLCHILTSSNLWTPPYLVKIFSISSTISFICWHILGPFCKI